MGHRRPFFLRLLCRNGGGDEDRDEEFRKTRLVTRSGMGIPITLTKQHLFLFFLIFKNKI